MNQSMSSMEKQHRDCLSCANSFSLPAGEPYDDGSVCEHDRLVCMVSHCIVSEENVCKMYKE